MPLKCDQSYAVEPRFLNVIRSGKLSKKRSVQKLTHFCHLRGAQLITQVLACYQVQNRDVFSVNSWIETRIVRGPRFYCIAHLLDPTQLNKCFFLQGGLRGRGVGILESMASSSEIGFKPDVTPGMGRGLLQSGLERPQWSIRVSSPASRDTSV